MMTCEKGFSITIGPVWEFVGTFLNQYQLIPDPIETELAGLVNRANVATGVHGASTVVNQTDFTFGSTPPFSYAVGVANNYIISWEALFWLPATLDFTKKWRIQFDAIADFGVANAFNQPPSIMYGYFFTDPQTPTVNFATQIAATSVPTAYQVGCVNMTPRLIVASFDETLDTGGVPKGLRMRLDWNYLDGSAPAIPGSPPFQFSYTNLVISQVP